MGAPSWGGGGGLGSVLLGNGWDLGLGNRNMRKLLSREVHDQISH